VTGAGGAVGRATILQFARDGVVKLAGLDVVENALKETERLLKEVSPDAQFLSLVADLTNGDQVKAAFQSVIDQFGRVDYAVNNAGIGSPHTLTADAQDADFERVIGVNVKGVWNCERLELAQMVKQEPLPSAAGVYATTTSRL
jgi:NAD(P)-dependent dehydrogenase (short-subunit alcohol dehydrogenase family)